MWPNEHLKKSTDPRSVSHQISGVLSPHVQLLVSSERRVIHYLSRHVEAIKANSNKT